MYSDAHFHLSERMKKILETNPLSGIISCTTPKECIEAEAFLSKHPSYAISCGIHPWKCDTITWKEMLPFLEKAQIIGEIGMDNVWCKKDIDIQKNIFEKQLQFAMQHKKTVVLHTKGMEKEILECIRLYPNTYHVHWYSCMEYVEEYRDLDCYFSIGPFPSVDKSVQKVCQLVPCDRLLIESDGIDAISWAIHRNIQDDEYLSSLYTIAKQIGDIKKKTAEEILEITYHNLQRFLTQKTL